MGEAAKSSAHGLRHAPRLSPGDRVAVVAPSSPFDHASFEAGLSIIGGRYRAEYDASILEHNRYLAGSDDRRAAELIAALSDPEVKAVFCARGGYGVLRLLPKLAEVSGARSSPKPVIGFSDITALHSWMLCERLPGIHGPVLTQLGRLATRTHARLFSLLESPEPAASVSGTLTFAGGQAEGALVGGNLSVLTRLLGTPFMPPLHGAVLLLEDVGERPYRLDRMWTHLQLAGVFQQVSGIVLGTFTGCEERDADYTSTEVLRELAAATGLPCAAGFPIGHGDQNEPVPLGVRVRLDADSATLTFLEAPVQ